jgi:hypothetical protein
VAHHLLGGVAKLAAHCVEADWRAAGKRLQPGRAVRVAEGLRPELAGACGWTCMERCGTSKDATLSSRGPAGISCGIPHALSSRADSSRYGCSWKSLWQVALVRWRRSAERSTRIEPQNVPGES